MGCYGLGSILIILRMLVSMLPSLHATTHFPKYVLMGLSSFAIWDWNKVIIAISVTVWVINLAFQLIGELTVFIPCDSQRMWSDTRYHQSKWSLSITRLFCLIHKQIRAVWVPAARACAITNVETCKGFYVNLLATDVILLLIMLVGLQRLRRGDSGRPAFDLVYLLWKQVGRCSCWL